MNIPATFTYQGKTYKGFLHPVHGAGINVWHLMIDNFYYGRLRYHEGWVFDSVKMEGIAETLGEIVVAWRDGQE